MMSQIDAQLVQQIADEVMRALKAPQRPASPPLGLCTGESKSCSCGCDGKKKPSTEHGAGPDKPAVAPPPVTTSLQADPRNVKPQDTQPVLDGFVTANALRDALASSPDGVAVLAAAARLTPLAQDIVRSKPDCVRRRGVPADKPTLSQVVGGLPWMWWTCGDCDAVKKIVSDRRSILLPSTAPRGAQFVAQAVRDIDDAISNGRAAGGLMFVSQAARPMCLVNRRRSLRAILGTCDDAVRVGISAIGPNVLVLEFPFNDHDAMARRVDMMLAASPNVPAQMRALLATVGD